MSQFESQVIACIKDSLNTDQEITPRTALSSLGMDSLDVIELLMNMEDHFEVELDDDLLYTFYKSSVGDVVKYLESLVV